MPPVVTGYLLLLTFGRRGSLGAPLAEYLGIVFSFRWTGAALACAVMAFPLLVRAMRLSFEAVDRRLEEAAGTLGASRLWVFATVTLPLAVPGVLAGMVLAYAKALGEFGATITFVSNIPGETQTLPSAIYTFTQVPGGEAGALRLTLVSIALLVRGADRLGAARAAGGPPGARRLMLEVDIERPLGAFTLQAGFATAAGVTALFGRSGAGKTSIVNAVAGLLRPRRGRIVLDGEPLFDTAARHRRAAPSPADRLRVPGAAPVPASHRAPQPALRPLVHAARPPPRQPRRGRASCWASAPCWSAGPARCRAARSSASRSAARCWPARACS